MRKIDVLSADDVDERVGAVHWLVSILGWYRWC